MSTEVLVFDILAIIAVIAALGVVLARNPVHSAVSLIITFINLAAIFVMLHAEFLAAVQLLVYTGAVTVLIVFVIFLVRVDDLPEFYGGNPVQRIFALLIGLALLGEVAAAILTRSAIGASDIWTADAIADAGGNVQVLGQILYTDYVLAIQITAVVLLVGTIAALVLARPESSTLPGRVKRTGLISLAHPRGADRGIAPALPAGLEATRRGETPGVRFDDRGVVLVDNAEDFTETTAWGGDVLEGED
ncbi:MAG: NADH-quinone oxidoreductase subunit J [Thermomicrobiales bacterium]